MKGNDRFRLCVDMEGRNGEDGRKWLVVSDTINGVAIHFAEHKFNETQRVEIEDEGRFNRMPGMPMALARIMREIGEWLYENHADKAFYNT